MIFYQISILIISLLNYHAIDGLSCKDETGNDVDWYLIYRPPKNLKPSGATFDGYFYFTSKGAIGDELLNSQRNMFATDSMFGKTFAEIYRSPAKYDFVQYNNQADGLETKSLIPTDAENTNVGKSYYKRFKSFVKKVATKRNIYKNFAKSKGALIWTKDGTKAMWYVSSAGSRFLPKFEGGSLDSISKDDDSKGHMSMCINLHYGDVKKILQYLIIVNVQVYGGDIDRQTFNEIKKYEKTPIHNTFSTPSIQQFFTIKVNSHNEKFGTEPRIKIGEFYDSDIKSSNLSSIRKQRWNMVMRRYKCKYAKTRIADILSLKYKKTENDVIHWVYKDDKSKWMIDVERKEGGMFCFSDLNKSEFRFRSGLILCLKSDLNNKMRHFIDFPSCYRN